MNFNSKNVVWFEFVLTINLPHRSVNTKEKSISSHVSAAVAIAPRALTGYKSDMDIDYYQRFLISSLDWRKGGRTGGKREWKKYDFFFLISLYII